MSKVDDYVQSWHDLKRSEMTYKYIDPESREEKEIYVHHDGSLSSFQYVPREIVPDFIQWLRKNYE